MGKLGAKPKKCIQKYCDKKRKREEQMAQLTKPIVDTCARK